ncbi:MAG: DUF1836 domain-containing protein [Lachnospiraceae bacterium]|nr:DUF1836 domain-containing protein [Lachnospiraceae bacterium]
MQADKLSFDLPSYKNIPNVGLYLEQVVKYVNEYLSPINISITPSMVSNYAKQGYIDRPVKRQYFAPQIAQIIFIAISKQALSMENIATLLNMQKADYDVATAYNTFSTDLKDMVYKIASGNEEFVPLAPDADFGQRTLRSVIISLSHIINLNYYFMNKDKM